MRGMASHACGSAGADRMRFIEQLRINKTMVGTLSTNNINTTSAGLFFFAAVNGLVSGPGGRAHFISTTLASRGTRSSRLRACGRSTTTHLHGSLHVCVQLRSAPSLCGANLPSFQPERAAEIRAHHVGAVQLYLPQDCSCKVAASQIGFRKIGLQKNSSLG